ncbi:MAG: hypothetical protein A2538_03675 [Candidatus Magasanikbacteria bacterium RIFOXYD2_FULL_41_14]|uniref:Uncharacterized protein n=1 Tax=Candidatus Magasanikbacteria bacterium RIFOXYD2_FULL_41_14 TaxID=1798709 RepID=A0A1F6PCU2_9BACT|nr:MAG: hypothetical protein A2538_03675 [Candidatus Magasanikbacteria bacterium RIFOXYD2_FULL_41_14]
MPDQDPSIAMPFDFDRKKIAQELWLPQTKNDLMESNRLGADLFRKLNSEIVTGKKLEAGSWIFLAGFLAKSLGHDNGLSVGDLKGFKIADIGGGHYSPPSSFGPNLARALAYLGAEVFVVDPKASNSDFAEDSFAIGSVSVVPKWAQELYEENDGPISSDRPVDIVTSSAFVASPGSPNDSEYPSLLDGLRKISNVQIHLIQINDAVFLGENGIIQNIRKNVDGVKYCADVSAKLGSDSTETDFIVIDSRFKK